MIAAGAIVRYAIADAVDGVNLALVGLTLIVVGVVGFFVSLITYATRRRDFETGRDPYPLFRSSQRTSPPLTDGSRDTTSRARHPFGLGLCSAR